MGFVFLVTTDLDAGRGVVTAVEAQGFDDQIAFKGEFTLIDVNCQN